MDEAVKVELEELGEELGNLIRRFQRSIVTEAEAEEVAKLKAKHEYRLAPYIPTGANLYYGKFGLGC